MWSREAGSVQQVSDSAHRVYRFVEAGATRFLRLISSADRTRSQIEAELDFIAHLHRGGVGVALPVLSKSGERIEEIPAGAASLFACVFNEAPGRRFRYDPAVCHRDHFRMRGKALGRIHALSRSYVPGNRARRFAWHEDNLLLHVHELLPESERTVWREYDALMQWLRELPASSETYGLIHGDFGETNYRYDRDRVTVFDFDDCCYHWFAYDLAIAIYPHGWRREALQLLEALLEGYAVHMPGNVTLKKMTMFCRWRLLYMFLAAARKTGFEHLPARQAEWFARTRENIARGYTWGWSGS